LNKASQAAAFFAMHLVDVLVKQNVHFFMGTSDFHGCPGAFHGHARPGAIGSPVRPCREDPARVSSSDHFKRGPTMQNRMAGAWLLVFANACCAEPIQLQCQTLGDTAKSFSFGISIDAARMEVFVDGQYTTDVSISDYLTSFVLAGDHDAYTFDIYANGRLIATRAKNKSVLLLQCT
jgi:hypothetical protein